MSIDASIVPTNTSGTTDTNGTTSIVPASTSIVPTSTSIVPAIITIDSSTSIVPAVSIGTSIDTDTRSSTNASIIRPQFITQKEAAKVLRIGKTTYGIWKAQGLIGPEPLKIGRTIRYPVGEFLEWIEAGCPNRNRWQASRRLALGGK